MLCSVLTRNAWRSFFMSVNPEQLNNTLKQLKRNKCYISVWSLNKIRTTIKINGSLLLCSAAHLIEHCDKATTFVVKNYTIKLVIKSYTCAKATKRLSILWLNLYFIHMRCHCPTPASCERHCFVMWSL